MSYTHLTMSERSKIETYLELGYSIRAIAKRIHRSPSTISRELRRHQNCTMEQALQLINHRSRKCLGWKTAYEAFEEELLRLI